MPAGIGYSPEAIAGLGLESFFQSDPRTRFERLKLQQAQGGELSPEEMTLLSLLGQRPEVRTTAQNSRIPIPGVQQPQQQQLKPPGLLDFIFGFGGVTPTLDTAFQDAHRRGGLNGR